MTITLYNTSSENNQVTKTLSGGLAFAGTLRAESDVMNPSILIENDGTLLTYNYAYIDQFSRYYFIDNITSIRNNLWLIKMHIDVLMTYDSSIRSLYAIVSRQQDETYQDAILTDRMIPLQANETTQIIQFPKAFSKSLYYVLAVAGG